MKLKSVVAAILLVCLLPSVALADDGRGGSPGNSGWNRDPGGTTQTPRTRLASGTVGAGQTDSRLTVVPPSGASQNAIVCGNVPDNWSDEIQGSKWVSTKADCTADFDVGDFTYFTTFRLQDDSESRQIEGTVLSDDSVTIKLNGNTIFTGGALDNEYTFSTDDSSLFVDGTNTLTFVVHNVTGPTGLDFVATIGPDGAVDEMPTPLATPPAKDRDAERPDLGKGYPAPDQNDRQIGQPDGPFKRVMRWLGVDR